MKKFEISLALIIVVSILAFSFWYVKEHRPNPSIKQQIEDIQKNLKKVESGLEKEPTEGWDGKG